MVRQLAHHAETGPVDAGQHAQRNAGGARPFAHLRAVRGELSRVQVAMGIDPVGHSRIMPEAMRQGWIRDTVQFRFWPALRRS